MVIRRQRSDGIWVSASVLLQLLSFDCTCYPTQTAFHLPHTTHTRSTRGALINFCNLHSLSPTGDQEISPIHPQVNATEPDSTRTWSATSVVQVSAMRERHGDMLRCVAFHENYEAKSVPVEARMDVKCKCKCKLC